MSAKTRRVIVEAAKANGALRVEFEAGGRHDKYEIHLPNGLVARDTISLGKQDDFKVRGWIRQLINRTTARAATA
jgi:hypothetical protein